MFLFLIELNEQKIRKKQKIIKKYLLKKLEK